jgi:NTP pyrophosphatase (non-canonical NTP hydrolase)
MPTLLTNPTIRELQDYIAEIERERGFVDQSAIQKCLLLGEEMGELFKAVRKCSGIKVDPMSPENTVREELADVLSFILAIANRFEIDLAAAFLEKEQKNSLRTWC